MLYKIVIEDRNYTKWQLYEAPTLMPSTISEFDPAANHLFSNDVFEHNASNGLVEIIHSSTRVVENIPAVLILADNKTYGRHPINNKLMYKFI